jgi:hypothetical protein
VLHDPTCVVSSRRWSAACGSPGQPQLADLVVTVVDSHQGRGLGTLLRALLAAAARTQGIERLRSYVLATEVRMLAILDQLGRRRCGMEGSPCCVETPRCAPDDLPDTPAGRTFRGLARRRGGAVATPRCLSRAWPSDSRSRT